MRKLGLAVALLSASGSAQAVVYTGELTGTVSARFATMFTAPDAVPDIEIGDTIVARFSFVQPDAEDGGTLGATLGHSLAAVIINHASFELGGYRWTSRGDFLAGLVTPQFGTPADPFAPLTLTMDDAPGAGDLAVQGYAFEIGEFGYQLYQGHGYAGAFDLASLRLWTDGAQTGARFPMTAAAVMPVPEAATWALMIGGFGLTGCALRRRRPVVSFG